ncbi:MAG: M20/M25/M40 family metallo-hydrolase, partial [Terriglobales bacterium]
MDGLKAAVAAHEAEAIALWRRWVQRETPSGDRRALEILGHAVAAAFESLAFEAEFVADGAGAHVILRGGDGQGTKRGQNRAGGWLLLGHLDTVYPRGTAAQMPWREQDGRFYGPGVMDMKGGIALAWLALRAMQDLNQAASTAVATGSSSPRHPPGAAAITILLVSDEETGSAGSRALTEKLARASEAVLVLEPGGGESGKLKTARKGIANFVLRAEGKAAHAGVDFFAGANAIIELARQAAGLAGWSQEARGITVNCGVIRGGTRGNVVPAEAELVVDARAWTARDLQAIETRIRALEAVDPKVRLTVSGGLNRPPMERSAEGTKLFARAQEAGRAVGVVIEECATGGGS